MSALANPISAIRRPANAPSMWVPFVSLLLGGITVHIAGKQPDILYFDVIFGMWIVYQAFWRDFFPSLSDSVVRIGVFCILSGVLSTLASNRDMYRGVAATKALAVGILVYAVARKAPLGLVTPSVFGALASILILR